MTVRIRPEWIDGRTPTFLAEVLKTYRELTDTSWYRHYKATGNLNGAFMTLAEAGKSINLTQEGIRARIKTGKLRGWRQEGHPKPLMVLAQDLGRGGDQSDLDRLNRISKYVEEVPE